MESVFEVGRNMFDTNGNGKQSERVLHAFENYRTDNNNDTADLDFVYADADTHANEIAELYSYAEQSEFQLNVKAFEEFMESCNLSLCWGKLSLDAKKGAIIKLLNKLEVSNRQTRMSAARCILYIAQGCWAEVQSDCEQMANTKENVLLLYDLGAFHSLVELLNIEIENPTAALTALRKFAVSLADSIDLRVIMCVLYIMVEVMRSLQDDPKYEGYVSSFKYDLTNTIGDELLIIKLFNIVTKYCGGSAPHFPMKVVLLLLWKVILVSLGGTEQLKEMKLEYRKEAGLDVLVEDSMEVIKNMRASSPPIIISGPNLFDESKLKEYHDKNEYFRNKKPRRTTGRCLMKQSSLDEGVDIEGIESQENDDEIREFEDRQIIDEPGEPPQSSSPRPMTPIPEKAKRLPWVPKVRQKDLDNFLENTRLKFVGFPLQGDRDSLMGLPLPIHEGVRVLKQHMYKSLSEVQIQVEEDLAKNPISKTEGPVSLTPVELLYQAIFQNLPQYVIALLKILLAAAPTSKTKTDSINIMADVLPEEMPMTVLQSMKLGTDVNRHKEIIVKAISGILLLLLKHFKLNHIYQFEFMSQHLVFANCIPLVLKFFNQNISAYVGAKNVIPILDFPSCVIGDQPELTAENLEIGDNQQYSWRNLYSCINLLRILNKLTKWKHSRIMMLVVFKSSPILKKTLKVRQAMMQLYVLKLLKMQTKYLGRQWRKNNMQIISAIYQKVRHRLNDDWAYGNDVESKPWDFQGEECSLRASVDRFNSRRYGNNTDPDFEPVDNCINSVLGQKIELTDEFKKHYHLWLQQEVFQNQIKWDQLLQQTNTFF